MTSNVGARDITQEQARWASRSGDAGHGVREDGREGEGGDQQDLQPGVPEPARRRDRLPPAQPGAHRADRARSCSRSVQTRLADEELTLRRTEPAIGLPGRARLRRALRRPAAEARDPAVHRGPAVGEDPARRVRARRRDRGRRRAGRRPPARSGRSPAPSLKAYAAAPPDARAPLVAAALAVRRRRPRSRCAWAAARRRAPQEPTSRRPGRQHRRRGQPPHHRGADHRHRGRDPAQDADQLPRHPARHHAPLRRRASSTTSACAQRIGPDSADDPGHPGGRAAAAAARYGARVPTSSPERAVSDRIELPMGRPLDPGRGGAGPSGSYSMYRGRGLLPGHGEAGRAAASPTDVRVVLRRRRGPPRRHPAGR